MQLGDPCMPDKGSARISVKRAKEAAFKEGTLDASNEELHDEGKA